MNLAGVRSIALGLPALTRLECNSCLELRSLEIRCPALLAATFQSTPVTRPMLDALAPGAASLTNLDLQYNWGLEADVKELSQGALQGVHIEFKARAVVHKPSHSGDTSSNSDE